jgi:ribulose-5-phosphate 4-epimerase/fuculose-1-phosphate aldolase
MSSERSDLADAAHVLARLGLVTAFGHVSTRPAKSMLITPAADLATVAERDVGVAVTRMWLLSTACDVYLTARASGQVTPLTADEIASWRAVGDELIPRLWQHLRRTGGRTPPGDDQPGPSRGDA